MEKLLLMCNTTSENEKHDLDLYYNSETQKVEAYIDAKLIKTQPYDITDLELKLLTTDFDDLTEDEEYEYDIIWEEWSMLLATMLEQELEELEEKERSEAMTINEAITQLEDLFKDRESLLDKTDLIDNPFLKDMEAIGIILDILNQLKDYPQILEACYENYLTRKIHLQNEAIEWQRETANESLSYGELAEAQERFEEKAKRYGLLEEFVENGIC